MNIRTLFTNNNKNQKNITNDTYYILDTKLSGEIEVNLVYSPEKKQYYVIEYCSKDMWYQELSIQDIMESNYYRSCQEFNSISDSIKYFHNLTLSPQEQKYVNLENHLKINHSNLFETLQEERKNYELSDQQYYYILEKTDNSIKRSLKQTIKKEITNRLVLSANKTYEQIIKVSIPQERFNKRYSFPLESKEHICMNAYPDYMPEESQPQDYDTLDKLPNNNYLFRHAVFKGYDNLTNDYIYETYYNIISEQEKEKVINYWKQIQEKNEIDFENQYIANIYGITKEQYLNMLDNGTIDLYEKKVKENPDMKDVYVEKYSNKYYIPSTAEEKKEYEENNTLQCSEELEP